MCACAQARTKSLFSVMKKLLQLGDMSRGGRARSEVYDLLGMRAIVTPAQHLPPSEAEAAATRACYIVQVRAPPRAGLQGPRKAPQ